MRLSSDDSHHFELLRIIGHSYYGGADVQECLQVAAALIPGDDESWYREWHALAERVQATADASSGPWPSSQRLQGVSARGKLPSDC